MVCGVYGMNFDHMPEAPWTFGYPVVLASIVLTCTMIYRAFRRNGWLRLGQPRSGRHRAAG